MAAAAPPGPPSPTSFSVDGKTAIVTGAGSGINLAFAALLLARNCSVILADLSLRPEAQALVARHSHSHAHAARALFVPTDVTSWPALQHVFDVALREFGGVDVVCPGAGVYEPAWSSFWHPPGSPASRDTDTDGRYALLDINLAHPIRATQLALSLWLPRRPRTSASPRSPKRIVHISSVAGQMPNFNAPLYGASKFGITGLVRSLAPLEARHGIRVNAVAPGVVRTPLWEEHPDKMAYLDPARDGWVTPDEVAAAMLRCVEEDGLVGGTVLEVGKDHTRCVAALNDPGPRMDPREGLIVRNPHEGHDMIYKWLEDDRIWGPPKANL